MSRTERDLHDRRGRHRNPLWPLPRMVRGDGGPGGAPSRSDRVKQTVDRLLAESDSYEGRIGKDLITLWREFISPSRHRVIVAMLLSLAVAVVPYCFSWTFRFLVDEGLTIDVNASQPVLAHHVRMVVLFFAINMLLWTQWLVCDWFRHKTLVGMGKQLVFDLRKRLHEKLQRLHVGFFERTSTGTIMSRVLDDVNVIFHWSTQRGPHFAMTAVQLTLGFTLLALIAPKVLLLALVAVPAYMVTFRYLRPRIKKVNRALRRLNAKMYALSTERIAGIRTVQAFTREKGELRRFSQLTHDSIRVAMGLVRYTQGFGLTAAIISATTSVLMLYVTIGQYRSGEYSIGYMFFIWGVMGNLMMHSQQMATIVGDMQMAFVVLRRVLAVLEEPEEVPPGEIGLDGIEGEIEFRNVTFFYPGLSRPALENVNFTVQPGEMVAVMGPSGSGKSTLFQLLLRFYDPQHGSVRVGGVDLKWADPISVRQHIRMVQQEPTVFAATIGDNIRYGYFNAPQDAVERAARQAELHEFIATLPQGYDTLVGEHGTSLSGGQRQRLALATALLTDPEVLLLDDTTSALDAGTEARIRRTLRSELVGRTSLIITQRIATARTCDRILVFDRGKLVQQGTHEDLVRELGFYAEINAEQQERTVSA